MDYDKILVLDAGHLVEFDTPRNLLAKEGSVFKALVDRSGDKEKLIKLAQ
jgi:ABC-type multidrug transport system fused ATPase/permease subunit